MQVKKEDIKDRILSSARREFLKCGFVGASLRVIAENEGLTKGAIYSYFKSKDELFCELTAPAINFIESEFQHSKGHYPSKNNNDLSNSYEATIQSFRSFARAVLKNRESFKLLLFCAAGSNLQNYKERMIQLYSKSFNRLLMFFTRIECQRHVISEMFIHTLAATYVNFLEELVLHEPERKEADDYAKQMAIFVQSGIENLYFHQAD